MGGQELSRVIWEAVFNNAICRMLCITQIINYLISLSDISSHPGPFSILIEVTCSSLTSLILISFLLSLGTVLFSLFSLHQNMPPLVTSKP